MIEAITGGYYEKSMLSQKSSTMALIDADSLLYYCMGEPTFEECKIKLDLRMFDILTECDTTMYSAFLTPFDTFRRGIAFTKPYKGNREGKLAPPLFYALKAYAIQEWGFVKVEGVEADDCMVLYREPHSVICSPDKDVLRQLPGIHYNYGGKEGERWVTTTEEEAEKFLWIQTISGDSTDGIQGIYGMGEIKAERALSKVPRDKWGIKSLKLYLDHYEDPREGIEKFKETFDLVQLITGFQDRRLKDLLLESHIEVKNALDLFEP